jgi:hypothetical protein
VRWFAEELAIAKGRLDAVTAKAEAATAMSAVAQSAAASAQTAATAAVASAAGADRRACDAFAATQQYARAIDAAAADSKAAVATAHSAEEKCTAAAQSAERQSAAALSAVAAAESKIAVAVEEAQTAARTAKGNAAALSEWAADVKSLMDVANAAKAKAAAADSKVAVDAKSAADPKAVRFDPSTGSNNYVLSNDGKTVTAKGSAVTILRELRSGPRTGPIEVVRVRCDTDGGGHMGFISDLFCESSNSLLGFASTAGVAQDNKVFADTSIGGYARWKAGYVLTLTANIAARTFSVQTNYETPVTMQWVLCPPRMYFAVAIQQGAGITLL